jgi:hypothetical protein
MQSLVTAHGANAIRIADINGDGKPDLVLGSFGATAVLMNITAPGAAAASFVEADLPTTSPDIGVADFNGDGLPDLITSMGHDYGIFWYEQQMKPDGTRGWVKHVIDDTWSQSHALTMVDLLGDGRLDLVTGKRFHSHPHDPGAGRQEREEQDLHVRRDGRGGQAQDTAIAVLLEPRQAGAGHVSARQALVHEGAPAKRR